MPGISSLQHPMVKHFVKLQNKKSYRQEKNSVVIEGKKMVAEAEGIKTILSTEPMEGATIVTPAIIKKITSLECSDGILAEVKLPAPQSIKEEEKVLVLDRINDPGNLGTLIRTALAFGWNGIFLLEGSADPFGAKALRAAKGATFRVKLEWGSFETLKSYGSKLFAADLKGSTPQKYTGKRALILGSEAHGIAPEILKDAEAITLPMENIESLNVAVAGGILMNLL